MEKTFRGVIAASVTPFHEDRSVDTGAVRALMRYYAASGLCGAFMCSSSGEYYAMTDAQREQVIRAASDENAGIMLLAQISADRADAAIERAKRMAGAGADAVVAQPPRFLDYSTDELYAYFTEIADGSPVPLILYNHLTRLNNKLQIPLLKRLTAHENILAVKDTHNDAERMRIIAGELPHALVYAGGDSMAGEASLHGAFLLNALAAVAPKLMLDILAAGQRGDEATTVACQAKINDLAKIYGMIRRDGGSITAFSSSLRAILAAKGLCGMQCAQLGVHPTAEECEAIARYAAQFA